MKTPVTQKMILDHLTYSWWKYALVILLSCMGWSIIYSMTAYRVPDEKKVVLGVYSYGSSANIDAYMEAVRLDSMTDMEEMTSMYIMPDSSYGEMILTTRIAARDCDIYVLPRTQFQNLAEQGGFMALDEVLPELVAELEASGISLSRGWRTYESTDEETGETIKEKHFYGVPTAELPSIAPMLQCDTSDMYICVFFNTGNDENTLKFFEKFIRDMMQEPIILTDEPTVEATAEPAAEATDAPAAE